MAPASRMNIPSRTLTNLSEPMSTATETQTAPTATPVRRDFRQEVTDPIIRMLGSGVAPWQKPWEPGSLELPHNPTTARSYRGGNALHLLAVGTERGYQDPRWMTYKQAQENGWQVHKGEKGTQIEYWQFNDRQSERRDVKGDDPARPSDPTRGPIRRVYTVFNAGQIAPVEAGPPKTPRALADRRSRRDLPAGRQFAPMRAGQDKRVCHCVAALEGRQTTGSESGPLFRWRKIRDLRSRGCGDKPVRAERYPSHARTRAKTLRTASRTSRKPPLGEA